MYAGVSGEVTVSGASGTLDRGAVVDDDDGEWTICVSVFRVFLRASKANNPITIGTPMPENTHCRLSQSQLKKFIYRKREITPTEKELGRWFIEVVPSPGRLGCEIADASLKVSVLQPSFKLRIADVVGRMHKPAVKTNQGRVKSAEPVGAVKRPVAKAWLP